LNNGARAIRFFGLSLSREVNILALIAFVLSSSSLAIQGWQYYRGARVTMTVGERVNLVRVTHPALHNVPFLVVNARLNYLNTGALGRDAIIESERLHIGFDDRKPFEYRWLHFELLVPDAGGGWSAMVKDGAHSFVAPGAGTASHQTTFVAFPEAPARPAEDAVSAAVTWNSFMLMLETTKALTLRFISRDIHGDEYTYECAVMLTEGVRRALDRDGWATALCLRG